MRDDGRPATPGDDEIRDATAWFEPLYAGAAGDAGHVPWEDGEPHRLLVDWLEREPGLAGARTLVPGCGLGNDAEALAARGACVTAFDLAPTAIDWAHRRWPDSAVDYRVADLFALPADWEGAFDLVAEIYTFQSLPATVRPLAMDAAARCLAPGGCLVVICRGREEGEPETGPPYPLLAAELERLEAAGLDRLGFEAFPVAGAVQPGRHFRALFARP